MNQTRTSFLVAVVAGVALLVRGAAPPASAPPAARGVPASAEAAAGGKPDRPPGAEAAQDSEDQAARRAYVGLYQEFLDVHPSGRPAADAPTQQVRGTVAEQPVSIDVSTRSPEEPDANALPEIARAAQRSHLRLEFMLAFVADPIDSRLGTDFDLALSALQLGLADAGYQFDRKWLPWVEPEPAEAAARKFRDRAGLLLFRRHRDPAGRQPCGFQEVGSAVPRLLGGNEIPGELLGVFLIGETPKLGIHKRAFRRAVDFVLNLHAAAAGLTPAPATSSTAGAGTAGCATSRPLEIPVLGPLYSGSIVSLRIAIGNVLAPDPAGAKADICFRIVSGTASAPGFERHLEAGLWPRVLASRTLLPDDQLAAWALGFLHDKLGWNLDRAALLVENDTSYGRHILEHDIPTATNLKLLSFPSGLFALRNAWEATAAGPPGSAPSTNRPAPSSSKTALDVSLADQGTPVDVVAEMSPLTSRIEDMAMANLLRQISRERIAYVGIMATDVKDELFLAEQIRRFAPNVVLFVFDNDLLYMHPQYNATMFSTVTISNFPLAAEGASSLLSAGTPDPKSRRQFASEWQEGIFLAVGSLVGRAPPPPAVWIAASGNYSMWPIAKLDVAPTERLPMRWPFCVERLGPSLRALQDCHGLAPDPSLRAVLEEHPPRQHAFSHWLTPMLGLVAISLFAFGGHFPRDPRRPRAVQPQTRRLQQTGTALLCLVGAGILVLGALSEAAWWHFLLLCACYLWLAWTFRRTVVPQEAVGGNRRTRLGWAARRATAVAVPVLLPLLVLWLIARWLARWGFDDARLFAERARSLSGGLSPLVSLAWLGGAVFLWLLVETMRQLQGERQRAGWPLSDDLAAPLAGAAARAERIIELLRPIFPRGWHLWWITGIVVVPFLHLLPRMQPIAEGRSYGIAALVGAAVVSALSLVAVFRMLRVWWCVRRLLISIAEAGLLEGVERVAPAVGWKPLQLLGYQPTVGVVTQSVVQLQRLIRLQLVPRRYDPDSLQWLLRQTFRGASEGSLGVEVEARQELNRRFDEACLDLQDQASWPTISDFLAVRLIAYLRYVFGQLRFSVLEATFTGLPLMMAAATYAFQPKRLATLFLWTTLTASSAVMLSALVQMDRDPVLSAIGRSEPGKVTRNWSFISKIVIYGILPVLGLVASQFPTMGRLLSGLIQPLSRVLGAG